jgi:hypothetical protein
MTTTKSTPLLKASLKSYYGDTEHDAIQDLEKEHVPGLE